MLDLVGLVRELLDAEGCLRHISSVSHVSLSWIRESAQPPYVHSSRWAASSKGGQRWTRSIGPQLWPDLNSCITSGTFPPRVGLNYFPRSHDVPTYERVQM